MRLGPGDALPSGRPEQWDLFSAGSFEEDVALVRRARAASVPPRVVCAVAAGVREFRAVAGDVDGTFGVGQWFPGAAPIPAQVPVLGPAEADFLAAYSALTGAVPDYPAVQAAAAAVLAVHCARLSGGSTRDLLWDAALALDTRTMFGDFRIRPGDGVQAGHQIVLVRWTRGRAPGRHPDPAINQSPNRRQEHRLYRDFPPITRGRNVAYLSADARSGAGDANEYRPQITSLS